MDIIVETDLGHDPDDFLAICYLVAAGVNIRAITIVPGDVDQIATAKFLCKELGLDIPVGVSKPDSNKQSSGSIHHALLNKYGFGLVGKHDGEGHIVIKDVVKQFPYCEVFAIGPVTNVGKYLAESFQPFRIATMQGGFLPYRIHTPQLTLDKFKGIEFIQTFNLNGDRKAADILIESHIPMLNFVGKNICHTVEYGMIDHFRLTEHGHYKETRAGELFVEAMDIYLKKHDNKKLHDPTAAICHLHPDIGKWVKGKPIRTQGGWTTDVLTHSSNILADVDYSQLWKHLYQFK